MDLLGRGGEGARILACGQSLFPSLNLCLSSPALLFDITGLSELKGISVSNDVVRNGALVTHSEIEKSAEIQKHVPMLAAAVPHVAHPAIRAPLTLGFGQVEGVS